MTDLDQRPLLFLDVDGPVIPFGGGPYPTHHRVPAAANPLLTRVDPRLGPRLAALPCDLVWATTWMAEANESIAPLLGLPPLAVVEWPDPEPDERTGLHWKTRHLVDRAAGRPFAWLDDELTETDRTWVTAHHPGPALLHRVDPRLGLTTADLTAVAEFLGQTP